VIGLNFSLNGLRRVHQGIKRSEGLARFIATAPTREEHLQPAGSAICASKDLVQPAS
jgi:hypothetical protein